MSWFDPFGTFSGGRNMLQSFLHPEDAFKAGADQSQQYYNQAQGYLQPIANQGQQQFGQLQGQASQLNNPAQLQNSWAQQYTQSPEAMQTMMDARTAGLDSASSQGLLGSSAALENSQRSAGNISNSYRQQFLQDLMQKYMASIGINQNIYGLGASAAGAQAGNAMGEGDSLATAAYGQKAAPGMALSNLLQAGMKLYGAK